MYIKLVNVIFFSSVVVKVQTFISTVVEPPITHAVKPGVRLFCWQIKCHCQNRRHSIPISHCNGLHKD